MNDGTTGSCEQWDALPGYEGIYEVSDLGDVRSLDRRDSRGNRIAGRVLRQFRDAGGYHMVNLSVNGHFDRRMVHQLVLETWSGRRPDGLVARHLNDDKDDNRLVNLRWGTQRENARDCVRNGHNPNSIKDVCPKCGGEYKLYSHGRDCPRCAAERSKTPAARARRRAYYLAHREDALAYQKKYRDEHPEKLRELERMRPARRRKLVNTCKD